MWNWALGQNGNESVSEFASRFGEKYDPEWREESYDPCIRAIAAFYADNGLEEDSLNNEFSAFFTTKTFCRWHQPVVGHTCSCNFLQVCQPSV
jgi:hypothetical protein